MIKYMGHFVSFVQYLPAKPIKHGIKVDTLCCSYTGYLYRLEIYTGKGGTADGSPMGVISRLLYGAGATGTTGRILYTDNFYTSLCVMKYIYVPFAMLLVGTYAQTKKKSLTADDFPFAKLSKGALKKVNRGWKQMAHQKIFNLNQATPLYTVQATVWKDKKLIGFLHNHLVADTEGHTVERWSPQKKKRKSILSHKVTTDYSYHINGVDRKDRDTAFRGSEKSDSLNSEKNQSLLLGCSLVGFFFRLFISPTGFGDKGADITSKPPGLEDLLPLL
jgi:hypothetical protein